MHTDCVSPEEKQFLLLKAKELASILLHTFGYGMMENHCSHLSSSGQNLSLLQVYTELDGKIPFEFVPAIAYIAHVCRKWDQPHISGKQPTKFEVAVSMYHLGSPPIASLFHPVMNTPYPANNSYNTYGSHGFPPVPFAAPYQVPYQQGMYHPDIMMVQQQQGQQPVMEHHQHIVETNAKQPIVNTVVPKPVSNQIETTSAAISRDDKVDGKGEKQGKVLEASESTPTTIHGNMGSELASIATASGKTNAAAEGPSTFSFEAPSSNVETSVVKLGDPEASAALEEEQRGPTSMPVEEQVENVESTPNTASSPAAAVESTIEINFFSGQTLDPESPDAPVAEPVVESKQSKNHGNIGKASKVRSRKDRETKEPKDAKATTALKQLLRIEPKKQSLSTSISRSFGVASEQNKVERRIDIDPDVFHRFSDGVLGLVARTTKTHIIASPEESYFFIIKGQDAATVAKAKKIVMDEEKKLRKTLSNPVAAEKLPVEDVTKIVSPKKKTTINSTKATRREKISNRPAKQKRFILPKLDAVPGPSMARAELEELANTVQALDLGEQANAIIFQLNGIEVRSFVKSFNARRHLIKNPMSWVQRTCLKIRTASFADNAPRQMEDKNGRSWKKRHDNASFRTKRSAEVPEQESPKAQFSDLPPLEIITSEEALSNQHDNNVPAKTSVSNAKTLPSRFEWNQSTSSKTAPHETSTRSYVVLEGAVADAAGGSVSTRLPSPQYTPWSSNDNNWSFLKAQ